MVNKRLPIVVLAGSALAGGGGAVVGAIGGVQIGRAHLHMRRHLARYDERYERHRAEVEKTNETVGTFGQAQEQAQVDIIFRMRDFLERHEKQVRAHAHLIVTGIDGSNPRVVEALKLDRDMAGWV